MAFITTIDQIKKANSSVTVDLSINSLRSFLADAEDRFLNIFGTDSFAELEGKTSENAYEKMKSAIVNLALWLYADSGQLLVSDSGMHVSKSPTLLPASDKKIVSFKRGVYRKAWGCFEQCLRYLEAGKLVFPVWHNSDQRKDYFSTFIGYSTVFAQCSSVQVSEDLFQLLRSEIRTVERDSIAPLLGEDIIDDLKTKLLNGTELTAIEQKCISKLQLAIAPLALAGSIPYLLIDISASGIFQVSEAALSSQSDNIEAKNIPNMRSLQRTMNRLISKGEAELESLRIWMNENQASFSGYELQPIAPMASINEDLSDTGFYFM